MTATSLILDARDREERLAALYVTSQNEVADLRQQLADRGCELCAAMNRNERLEAKIGHLRNHVAELERGASTAGQSASQQTRECLGNSVT